MRLSRPSRIIAALLVLVSVLFMQLAVAGYACPSYAISQDSEQSSEPMAMDGGQEMAGCAGADKAQPSLCHANDQAGNQSLDKPQLPHVQPFMAAALTLVFQHVEAIDNSTDVLPNSLLLARTTAPPLSIRNCCFRI
ncbi:MAG: silD [Collimonas fungivorans]|uniref:hypothetical protein n=1 Tax=Collimonas fungivorans TaxID=158899 RepID=UPI0026EC9C2A|nr:hypothetical protein [Collimonas fungivorans]MDB5765895.1 silD [Collimonas fungivorans]